MIDGQQRKPAVLLHCSRLTRAQAFARGAPETSGRVHEVSWATGNQSTTACQVLATMIKAAADWRQQGLSAPQQYNTLEYSSTTCSTSNRNRSGPRSVEKSAPRAGDTHTGQGRARGREQAVPLLAFLDCGGGACRADEQQQQVLLCIPFSAVSYVCTLETAFQTQRLSVF